jgi:hypothetical protein
MFTDAHQFAANTRVLTTVVTIYAAVTVFTNAQFCAVCQLAHTTSAVKLVFVTGVCAGIVFTHDQ